MPSPLPSFADPDKHGLKAACSRFFALLFFLLFLGGGIAILWALALNPGLHWLRARRWIAVPARIESSGLGVSNESKSDATYSIEVTYSYEAAGEVRRGERYRFFNARTNIGVESMRKQIQRLSPGTATICWVNPADPKESVLDRSLSFSALIGVFGSLTFLSVGVYGTLGACFGPTVIRRSRRRREALLQRLRSEGLISGPEKGGLPKADEPGRVIFARKERLVDACGSTAICLFWNGIVGAFVVIDIIEASSGNTAVALSLSLFLLPFVGAGISFCVNAIRFWRNFLRPDWLAVVDPIPGFVGGVTTFSLAALPEPLLAAVPVYRLRLVAMAGRFGVNGEPDGSGNLFSWRRNKRAELSEKAKRTKAHELIAVDVPVLSASRYTSVIYPTVPESHGKPGLAWGRWWELEVEHPDGSLECLNLY